MLMFQFTIIFGPKVVESRDILLFSTAPHNTIQTIQKLKTQMKDICQSTDQFHYQENNNKGSICIFAYSKDYFTKEIELGITRYIVVRIYRNT
ncbi:hypothetical protein RIR_jg17904.t1 [Rhizophagus irregularis DAOM 181602=DAOM 197198]|nr:hypothetical protein RIR_jg17904.t1 [Rhizophagus irregularis DAOM 181602=DAOM 197198]